MSSTRSLRKPLLFACLYIFILAAVLGNVQSSHAVQLSLEWNANSEPDVTGYKLHYGTQSRSYSNVINVGKTISYTVTGLLEGTTYYFALTAYNVSGLESAYSSEVSTTSTPSCTYSISSSGQSFSGSGGTTTVSVTAPQGCAWNASSGVSWVTITSGGSGSGNGTVALSVASNTGGSRAAGVTIAGKTFMVTQAAGESSCTYSISPTSGSFSGSGGTATVNVTAPQGCAWNASSGVSWVTITSGGSGTGNGTVALSVASNTGGSRTTGVTIAGKTFTVTQAAGAATVSDYTITASAESGGSVSPSGSVSVKAGASQTFRIKAGPRYRISSIIVDGTSVGAVSSYTFRNVNANHTIHATFSTKK
jgi:hypothetical protein